VDASIDFLAQNLLSTLDSQYRHLLAQSFTRSNSLLLCLARAAATIF